MSLFVDLRKFILGIIKKCEVLEIFSLCILIQFLQETQEYVYPIGDDCRYINHSNKYQMECPLNTRIILISTPEEDAKVECLDNNMGEYDLSSFPVFDVGDVTLFTYKNCFIPNKSFVSSLKKLNINKIENMTLDMIRSSNNAIATISKELFSGLSTLKALDITSSALKLEENFLENLPNLTKLCLKDNAIQKVSKNMFWYTPTLQILELPNNLISSLPKEVFKNLLALRTLNLRGNKLSTLNKYSFAFLSHLEILELSGNKIRSLDEDTFANIKGLVRLGLQLNNLTVVVSNIFKHNTALEKIYIGRNPNLQLSDYVFANLPNLTFVNIDSSELESLPQHIFEGSNNILTIYLKLNKIKYLPNNVFKGLVKLEKLNLDGNKLENLPNGIFSTLTNLKELYLNHNILKEITETLFQNTINLRKLYLSNNTIATIHLNASNLPKLTRLDLSNNQYNGTRIENLVGGEDIEEINLSYNEIGKFPDKILSNNTKWKLILNHNRIKYLRVESLMNVSTVELNHNEISILDFRDSKQTLRQFNFTTKLKISHNPIICNCSNFDLIQYKENIDRNTVDIEMNNLQCAAPRIYKDIAVKDLKPHQISCTLDDVQCPKQCKCDYRPYDNCSVIDCSYRNLTEAPIIQLTNKTSENIEVNLEGNKLKTAPYEGLGYENVTKLFLSNNSIRNLTWIPPNIEILELHRNELKFIELKTLQILNKSTTLKNLTLHGNPWNCDCSTKDLQTHLKYLYEKVNPNDVKCDDNSLLINRMELCQNYSTILLIIAPPVLIVLFAIAVLVATYFQYQKTINAWLYAKNLCLRIVSEKEIDKDRIYDIFISYSCEDENFITTDLLPKLEAFKICNPVSDWKPGEFISTQVTESILNSKRTLVVLSQHFLNSNWNIRIFKDAHAEASKEGRSRIIVVKCGELNEDELDSELKSYLKTNTYIEWGDPWFWTKLIYALPHLRSIRRYKTNSDQYSITNPSLTGQGVNKSHLTIDISDT